MYERRMMFLDNEWLRDELEMIMKENPDSLRAYCKKIGLGVDGRSLKDFLYDRRPSSMRTLLKIRKFVDENNSQEDYPQEEDLMDR